MTSTNKHSLRSVRIRYTLKSLAGVVFFGLAAWLTYWVLFEY